MNDDTLLALALTNSNLTTEDRALALAAITERAALRNLLAEIAMIADAGARYHKPPYDETSCSKRYEKIRDTARTIVSPAIIAMLKKSREEAARGELSDLGSFAAETHEVPPHVLDTFISSALKELGEQPFLVLPEHRINLLKQIVILITELKKGKQS